MVGTFKNEDDEEMVGNATDKGSSFLSFAAVVNGDDGDFGGDEGGEY